MPPLVVLPYALILAGAGLAFAGLLPAMVGWLLSALGVLAGVGVALAVLLDDPAGPAWGAGLAALPALVAVPKVVRDLRYPRLNDVSTDLGHPPAFVTGPAAGPATDPGTSHSAARLRGRSTAFPARNGPLIRAAYPKLQPLLLAEQRAQVVRRVIGLAARQPGWTVTHQEPGAGVVQSEAVTSVFRFVDDVVIRVGEQDGCTRVDLRSRSRDGLVDAGVNAKRIQAFLSQLAVDAAETTGVAGAQAAPTAAEAARAPAARRSRPVPPRDA